MKRIKSLLSILMIATMIMLQSCAYMGSKMSSINAGQQISSDNENINDKEETSFDEISSPDGSDKSCWSVENINELKSGLNFDLSKINLYVDGHMSFEKNNGSFGDVKTISYLGHEFRLIYSESQYWYAYGETFDLYKDSSGRNEFVFYENGDLFNVLGVKGHNEGGDIGWVVDDDFYFDEITPDMTEEEELAFVKTILEQYFPGQYDESVLTLDNCIRNEDVYQYPDRIITRLSYFKRIGGFLSAPYIQFFMEKDISKNKGYISALKIAKPYYFEDDEFNLPTTDDLIEIINNNYENVIENTVNSYKIMKSVEFMSELGNVYIFQNEQHEPYLSVAGKIKCVIDDDPLDHEHIDYIRFIIPLTKSE